MNTTPVHLFVGILFIQTFIYKTSTWITFLYTTFIALIFSLANANALGLTLDTYVHCTL